MQSVLIMILQQCLVSLVIKTKRACILSPNALDRSPWRRAWVGAHVVSGMCEAAWFRAGHRCLETLLTARLLVFLSSCCFCDLVWFLVSQKALFLGSVAAFSLAL